MSLARQIIDGFPEDKSSLPKILQPYWGMRNELYVVDMAPFKGRKMLIPSKLRPSVLEGLHAANQGVTGIASSGPVSMPLCVSFANNADNATNKHRRKLQNLL